MQISQLCGISKENTHENNESYLLALHRRSRTIRSLYGRSMSAGRNERSPDDDDVYLYKLQREGVTETTLYTLPYRPATKA
jgi:hypothetical protein